jgi:hypothetical protein
MNVSAAALLPVGFRRELQQALAGFFALLFCAPDAPK